MLEPTFLPVALNITGRRLLIVGGGRVGLHKATILARFTSEATVVSPEFLPGFAELPFTCEKKRFEPSDLDGIFLVYICTEDAALNRRIRTLAAERGVLVSVCDAPELCDVISPAIYRDGNLCIAVTSNGRDVRRSIRVRDRIAAWATAERLE